MATERPISSSPVPPSSAPSTTQRVFTTKDYLVDNAERTVRAVYRDQDFTALVEWIDPGKSFEEPHSHAQSAHTFVVIEGEGEALLEGDHWQRVKAGDFVVNPRNKIHAMRNTSKDKRLVWVCTHMPHLAP